MKHRNPESMEKIISFVNDFYRNNHRSPSLRQIAGGTGVPHMTVKRMLETMAEAGQIEYDGRTVMTDLSGKGQDETAAVGIIGNIPCGNLSLEEEAVEEIIQLPTALFGKGDLFLLHARGDSMTGAGINDGDLVLIRKQEEAQNGDIVVAFIEGEGNTLKRYKQYGHTIFLHPENPKYTDIPLKECKIQGIAVWVFRKVG